MRFAPTITEMALMRCGLKRALVALLLWPLLGFASPIYSGQDGFLSGWSNSAGTFEPDFGALNTSVPGNYFISQQNSYSTASSLFTYQASPTFTSLSTFNYILGAEMRIDALVKGNGTFSGELFGGLLTVRAGPQGIPEFGAAAGDILMTGYAIDSAASARPVGIVAFLFAMTYEVPALAGYGDYVTFLGALNNGGTCFAPCSQITPWGLDYSNLANYTYDALAPTRKVPEPATYALVLVAMSIVPFAIRRRRTDATNLMV